jgi:ABC-type transporter Mla subunit MlaD
MREQLQARRNELKRQFDEGQTELHQLQEREHYLREMMLRIGGALQVLNELLSEEQSSQMPTASSPRAESSVNQPSGAALAKSQL